MPGSSLSKKLQIRPGMRLLIMNAPNDYIKALGKLPEDIEIHNNPTGAFDFAHIFVSSINDLKNLSPKVLKTLEYDGVFWVSYPKKTSKIKTDISRDVGWDILKKHGLRPVAAVSIDETWSALRFRPIEKVKQR